MKTTGQDANPDPNRECATCGEELTKEEYELCSRCEERLGYRDPKPRRRPQSPPQPPETN